MGIDMEGVIYESSPKHKTAKDMVYDHQTPFAPGYNLSGFSGAYTPPYPPKFGNPLHPGYAMHTPYYGPYHPGVAPFPGLVPTQYGKVADPY